MGRIKRYIEPGAVYFVTSVTKDREKIFLDETAAKFLVLSFGYHRYMLGYELYGYVVMPDHFHMLVKPGTRHSISKIMKLIKGNFSRKYNEMMRREGSVWQQGYYDSVMRDRQDALHRLEYMHTNPVTQGLVSDPSEYPFSSFHNYDRTRRQAVQIVIDPII